MNGMKYKIGDVVYKSGTTYSIETIQCPDCLGTKEWIITFADGEAMIIGCQTCTKGFSPASGYISFNQWKPHVEVLTIGKIYDWNQDDGFRYMCEETGIGSGQIHKESDLFSDKESAEIDAKIKHEEQMKHIAQNNFSKKFRGREQIENMLSTFGFTRRTKIEKTRQFIQWAKISGILTKKEQALSEIRKLKGECDD